MMFLLLATPSQFFSWPGRAGLDKPDIVGCSGPQAMSKINTNINGSNTTTWSYAATHDVPDLRLAACDQDPLCGADNYYESERGHCLLTIGIADPKANSFIHLTRCSKSTTAGNYTSLTGGLYKHCDEGVKWQVSDSCTPTRSLLLSARLNASRSPVVSRTRSRETTASSTPIIVMGTAPHSGSRFRSKSANICMCSALFDAGCETLSRVPHTHAATHPKLEHAHSLMLMEAGGYVGTQARCEWRRTCMHRIGEETGCQNRERACIQMTPNALMWTHCVRCSP